MTNTRAIRSLYKKMDIPLDRLPYTVDFELMLSNYCLLTQSVSTLGELWRELIKLRKSGKLGTTGRRSS
jgi:hypothetical protein